LLNILNEQILSNFHEREHQRSADEVNLGGEEKQRVAKAKHPSARSTGFHAKTLEILRTAGCKATVIFIYENITLRI
jgi:hypothetical protein